jgi:uncharacterized protein (TIGR02147 family)
MIYEHADYRSYLRAQLSSQMAKNPHYSLRAFAKKLELAPSSLSEILSGKKNLSHGMASKVSFRLGLTAKETEYFILLADLELAASEAMKEQIIQKLQKLNKRRSVASLDIELFRVIADWYHIPIIEMTRLPHIEFSPATIAKKLGINPLEARNAIERLEKLELIEKDAGGRYRKVQDNTLFSSTQKNEALSSFHQQMLERASAALKRQSPKERYSGSETFCLDENLSEEAREIINDCFDKIVALAAKSKKPKHVYHLGIHFFPLTNGESK